MQLRQLFGVAAIAVSLAAFAAPASAVTITNGSFESGVNPGVFTTLSAGDTTSITGWKVEPNGVDYVGSYWQAEDGNRSIDLSGNDKGGISQMLSGLTVGAIYDVTFWLAGNPDGGGSIKTAVVSDNGTQASVFNFSQVGNTRVNMGWLQQDFRFTAASSTANLVFSSTLNNPYGPALDNVSISGGVPEPATWALMIIGFGGIGAALRRRRQLPLAA
jgi:choice-of-anchor C domain-containing protein